MMIPEMEKKQLRRQGCGGRSSLQCRGLGFALMLLVALESVWVADAQEGDFHGVLELTHGYAHLEGSYARRGERGISGDYYQTLVSHDRRRVRRMLVNVVDFPLTGDDNVSVTGLYYTQIGLGTPVRKYYVQVDTGSDILWLNCSPCTTCPLTSGLNIKLTLYNPLLSSTEADLSCSDPECTIASANQQVSCTSQSQCVYYALYGDGSSTNGYFVSDRLTYTQVVRGNSTNTTGSATVYFGCGDKQAGSLTSTDRALDGLIGFGRSSISVLSQLAAQKKTANSFAHCLQGDSKGSGTLVIGQVTEPNLTYTALVPNQTHYNVELLNIAVGLVNISSPSAFQISNTGGGTIMDSGTTLAYLVQPAYDQFTAAVEQGAPVQPQQIKDSTGATQICFNYSGTIDGVFPAVTLYFAGGRMVLGPKNYLIQEDITFLSTQHSNETYSSIANAQHLEYSSVFYRDQPRVGSNGSLSLLCNIRDPRELVVTSSQNSQTQSAYCIGWLLSASQTGYQAFTILGDIVLKDKLVVYDNDLERIGWKDFDCTKAVSVSSSNTSLPVTVMPGAAGPPGSSGSYPSSRPRALCVFTLLSCIVCCVIGLFST